MQNCGVSLGRLVPSVLRRRTTRFLVEVKVGGGTLLAHLPNTGRLDYALKPGAKVWLRRATGRRQTQYDVVLVEQSGATLVVDSSIQNRVVERALECAQLEEFSGYELCGREVAVNGSRIDFLLCRGGERLFLEVKGATLIVDGWALYPDAPTKRGVRHLETLSKLAGEGHRSALVFVALCGDAVRFKPNTAVDPAFTDVLRRAASSGVEVYAHRIVLGEQWVKMGDRIPVVLY